MLNPILIFPLLTLALLVIGLTFEILIRKLRSEHAEAWESLGKPTGFFPTSFSPTPSDIAAQKLMLTWFFHTPQWIRECRDNSLYILCVFRVAAALWIAGLFVWAVCILRMFQSGV
jgi:hypothetical protein